MPCTLKTKKVMKKTTLNSFLNNVIPEPNTGCWLWMGALNDKGYGNTKCREINENRAHRISYYLHFGLFDKTLCVLHKCDQPSCVNPEHLFLGTKKDNSDDKGKKKEGQSSCRYQ